MKPSNPGDSGPPADSRNRYLRPFLVAVVVGLIIMWFYAFFLAPSGNPDRLDDQGWSEKADRRCEEARTGISTLPAASESTSPRDRANQLEAATRILSAMVSDLGSLNGGSESDRALIVQWLEDWGTYLSDRRNHAQRLQSSGDVQPLFTALPDGLSLMERMNGFARVNEMKSCLDPGDL